MQFPNLLYICAAIGSALVSAGSMSAILRSRWSTAVVDRPNERSLHDRPVPRLGGVAIHGAAFLVALVAFALSPVRSKDLLLLSAIAVAAACLFVLSLMDDRRSLPIRVRLLAQVAASLIVAFLAFREHAGPSQMSMALCAALLIAWSTNAYNFMDGSNGLAGGMAVIGFGTYAWLAIAHGDEGLSLACLTLAGGALGFLRFNFGTARAFLGDCGSIPLGFLAGSLGLYGWSTGAWRWWTPAIVFLPFLGDATLTLVRRAAQGKKFWLPHREHAYQRLVLMGWSHRRVAVLYYAVMFACAAFASMLQQSRSPTQYVGLSILVAAIIAALVCVERSCSRRR